MGKFDINSVQLKIQSPQITIDEKLNDYILARIEKAGKVFNRIERCEMTLRAEEDDRKNDCFVEAKLFVPGAVLFASDKKSSFRQAVQIVFDEIQGQLTAYKEIKSDKTVTVK